MALDVNKPGEMEAVFEQIAKKWGRLDFIVHSIAFAPPEALQGRVVDVSREGFLTTMDVWCWTFIRMAHLAEPLMRKGGTMFTMTYYGSQMVVENYTTTSWESPRQRSKAPSATLRPRLAPKESASMPFHPGPWPRERPPAGIASSIEISMSEITTTATVMLLASVTRWRTRI